MAKTRKAATNVQTVLTALICVVCKAVGAASCAWAVTAGMNITINPRTINRPSILPAIKVAAFFLITGFRAAMRSRLGISLIFWNIVSPLFYRNGFGGCWPPVRWEQYRDLGGQYPCMEQTKFMSD